jgi:hypothetical protein
VHAWVVCAVTGLLVSPVSWDRHWVWIAAVLAVLTDTGVRASGILRAAAWVAAALVAVAFLAWPSVWPGGGPGVPWGLIWYAPGNPSELGASQPEYGWSGLQLVAGNLYVLVGLALLAAAAVAIALPRRDKLIASETTQLEFTERSVRDAP